MELINFKKKRIKLILFLIGCQELFLQELNLLFHASQNPKLISTFKAKIVNL